MFAELMFGGSSFNKIMLKLSTRLAPLWFGASRSVEVVEALAVARETKRRLHMPVQTRHFSPRRVAKKEQRREARDFFEDSGFFDQSAARQLAANSPSRKTTRRTVSIISRTIDRERVERSTLPPVKVPAWLVVMYMMIMWSFCIFSWIRFAQLAAPCVAAGTPWTTHCRTVSHPLFDFALPGPAGAMMCACNAFATTPATRERNGTKKTSVTYPYDCTTSRFMSDVHTGLFGGGAQFAATAPYVQTVMFYPGCAVNNTHMDAVFTTLKNIRVIAVSDATAIVPPLQIPLVAMKSDSQIMAMRLEGLGIEKIPTEIGRLRDSLSILLINRNAVREMPSELGECTNLGLLYFGANAISTVPPELGRLTGIASLGLYQNQISALPSQLGLLTNLKYLQVEDNLLDTLPSSLSRLSVLVSLSVSLNRLTAVPILDSQPHAWPKIRYMNLAENRIASWPTHWTLQRNVTVSQFNATVTAAATAAAAGVATSGIDEKGLYDSYLSYRTEVRDQGEQQEGGETNGTLVGRKVALVLMHGNPVVGGEQSNSTAGGGPQDAAQLWEFQVREGESGTCETKSVVDCVHPCEWNWWASPQICKYSPGGGDSGNVVMLVTSEGECSSACPSVPWKATNRRDDRGDSYCAPGCNTSSCGFDGGDCLRANSENGP